MSSLFIHCFYPKNPLKEYVFESKFNESNPFLFAVFDGEKVPRVKLPLLVTYA